MNFITVRLGKDSIADINTLCNAPIGIQKTLIQIRVRCTQIPDNFTINEFAFIWLGSDNNKGAQTKWKQGFKAIGTVKQIQRGEKYNDISETTLEIIYIFKDSINRLDILRCAPNAYYWCSGLPLIGIDDHANQTIRCLGGDSLCNIKAFFYTLGKVDVQFKKDIIAINPEFRSLFDIIIPNPKDYPLIKSIEDIKNVKFKKTKTQHYQPYFPALRTKPFMLLAGISGTGKSRIVREFAFKSCPKELQDKDGTEPGNYCMIEVKPNWHDSTEFLGYWSNLNKRYMFTKFAKFLVKAKMYPNVPFFVCLDEMNLAPVEQYFAEFLSVLETRKLVEDEDGGNAIIKSGVLIDKEYFRSIGKVGKDENEQGFATCKNDRDIYMKLYDIVDEEEMKAVPQNEETSLLDKGLTLPENVFVIGTVNMDDTTHQFSRKVIDRAMTIEMNGGALTDIFSDKDDLTYTENPLTMDDLRAKYISAKEVIKNCAAVTENEDIRKYIKGETGDGLPQRLEEINKALYGTPFMVSYRVMNELTIYLAVLLDNAVKDGQEISLEVCKQLANTAIDKILLMKILPRVEGDDEMFRISEKERTAYGFSDQADDGHEFTKLDWLRQIAPQHAEDNKNSYMAVDKLSEMIERLNRQSFTRFWP